MNALFVIAAIVSGLFGFGCFAQRRYRDRVAYRERDTDEGYDDVAYYDNDDIYCCDSGDASDSSRGGASSSRDRDDD